MCRPTGFPRCWKTDGNYGIGVPKRNFLLHDIPINTHSRARVKMEMAESRAPSVKIAKRSTAVSRVNAQERARQFKDADNGVLFCKFCQHSIDFVRVNTIKDHLISKKHCVRKAAKASKAEKSLASSSRQVTLSTVVKAKNLREEFVLDYIKMCTVADIPLEKTEKVRPFSQKHCPQAGALP